MSSSNYQPITLVGASKLIGFFFVTKLMLKIPKWFNISNFVESKKYEEPEILARSNDNEDVINLDEDKLCGTNDETRSITIGGMSLSEMFSSLFWNSTREFAEAG